MRTLKPVSEFILLKYGDISTERAVAGGDFTFTAAMARQAVAWFKTLGRKLAIDYEHQTFDNLNTRPDGRRPAAGWISKLEIRGDGLWAAGVEWTAQARALLTSGEYLYFSPVIYWTNEDYTEIRGLGPVGLTNDPAMKGTPTLAASQQRDERSLAMFKTVLAARPLSFIGQANGPVDQGEADTERALDLLFTAEELALVAGFFDYAFELSGPLATFLDQSKAMGRERWLTTAAALLDKAAPGNVAEAIKVIDLLAEISEHRQKLEAVEEPETSPTPSGLTVGRTAAAGGDEAHISICRREFAASAALRREYRDVETFIAFDRAERRGLVKIFGKARGVYSTTQPARTVQRVSGIADVDNETFATICRRTFNGNAALRAEFGSAETYIAFRRAEQKGLVNICAKSPGVTRG